MAKIRHEDPWRDLPRKVSAQEKDLQNVCASCERPIIEKSKGCVNCEILQLLSQIRKGE